MTSTLKVDNIAHSGGTTGMTIDSSGRILMPNVVAWFVGKNATQTASGNEETVTWPLVTFNQGSGFNVSGGNANKFVAPVHGIYTTSATLFSTDDNASNDVYLKKNSSNVIRIRNAEVSGYETYSLTWVGELDANDTLHLEIVTSGRSVYGDGNNYWSTWCGHLIG